MINQTVSRFNPECVLDQIYTLYPSVLQNIPENCTQGPHRDMNVVFAKDDRLHNRSNFSSAICPPDVPE